MGKKVLVVEDDRAIGELVDLILRSEGYRVVLNSNYEIALESVDRFDPDLVLIDSPDPRGYGPGWDLAFSLRGKGKGVPLVMFTGHVKDALEVGVTERGKLFAGAVVKPFDIDTLLSTVEAFTRGETERLAPVLLQAC